MTRNNISYSLLLLLLLYLGISCAAPSAVPPSAAPAADSPSVYTEAIPLTLDPSVARLSRGEKVIISIASNEWSELSWSVDDNFGGRGNLEKIDDLTVVYTAPQDGIGTVVVSVTGSTSDGRRGFARVQFAVE